MALGFDYRYNPGDRVTLPPVRWTAQMDWLPDREAAYSAHTFTDIQVASYIEKDIDLATTLANGELA